MNLYGGLGLALAVLGAVALVMSVVVGFGLLINRLAASYDEGGER
jgi:hypothetical protein